MIKDFLAKLCLKTGQKFIDMSLKLNPNRIQDYLESRPVESIDELRKILDDMGLQMVPIVEVGSAKIMKPRYDFLH